MESQIPILESELNSVSDPVVKVNLLNKLSDAVRPVNIERSLALSTESIELAKSISYREGLALAYRKSGVSSRLLSKYDDAFQYFEKSLEVFNELNNSLGKARVINSIGNIYLNLGDYKYSIEYLNKCLLILKDLDEKLFEASVHSNLGLAYQESGDFASSLETYLDSMKIYTENGFDVPESLLNNLGIVYMNLGDYPLALEYLENSLQLSIENNNLLDKSFALGNIGIVNTKLNNFEKALGYYNESWEILHMLGNKQAESNALANIGKTYKELGDYGKAIEYQTKYLSMQDEISDFSAKAAALISLGEIYFDKNSIEEAKKYYLEGLRVSQDHGDSINETAAYIQMGDLFAKTDNYAVAFDNYFRAIELAEKRNAFKDLSSIHKKLYEIHKSLGSFQKTLHHLEKHYQFEKEVSGIESERKLKSLAIQFRFKNAEKEKKIALQEKEIYRLKNIELAEANNNLIRMNEEKNEFMGIAAHDLKNPLSGILSFSRKIRKYSDSNNPEKASELAEYIEKASEKMFELITKMLDINAIESGKINMEFLSFDGNDTLKSIINNYLAQAESKNISISLNIHKPLFVFADLEAFSQIIDNLISNAVKFTLPGKNIEVTAVNVNNHARIEVKDEGPGLTEKDKTKIFGRFVRLSAQPTGNENSTGLGLSIARKLTELMSGKIWCESEQGSGSVFILELPLAKPQ